MAGKRRNLAVKWLLDLLFPRFCLRCGREGGVWCRDCDEVFIPLRASTACPFCKKETQNRVCDECRSAVFLDGVHALSSYKNPVVREAIKRWKYDGDRDIEGLIERWIRKRFSVIAFQEFEAITAVPLHETKRRARGFDQAEVFARMVSAMSGTPYRPLLTRTHKTKPQAQLKDTHRRVGELDGAFLCVNQPPSSVLLCDDVFTSGATMDAAAKALTEAGAGKIWGCAIARGGIK